MKTFRKVLSCLIAFTILTVSTVTFVGACFKNPLNNNVDTTLKFDSDGKFRILQFADIQDNKNLAPITSDFIKDILKKADPDLVVLTGDNIRSASVSKDYAKSAIDEYMSIFEEYQVPVAAVFGNHDDEVTIATKEYQMTCYESYSCFVGCAGDENIYGVGNYNLPILSSDESKTAFNIWCIDSGTYNEENDLDGYNCVRKDQIEWYKNKSNELKTENGGNSVNSIVFQHIIVPDIYDALQEVPNGTSGAVNFCDKYYVLPSTAKPGSVMNESPCPPYYNNGEFQAFVDQGDVIAVAVGHDHVNSFVVPYKGVDIICTAGVGFQSYGDENRGARLFVIDENDTSTYKTETYTYSEIYSNDPAAMARFVMYGNEYSIFERFAALLKYVYYNFLNALVVC